MRYGTWYTGKPQYLNHVYEVWNSCAVILAYHDGHVWRTTEGDILPDVTHYREV